MRRRRQLHIFFILYLTAVIGFIVISKDREHRDERMTKHNEHIIRTFLPEVPLSLASDTVRWYVSADSSGIVSGEIPLMRRKVFVHDIQAEDDIAVRLHSVIRDGVFTSPDIVGVGGRTAFGNIHEHTVYFPVTAAFPRTGRYHINLLASARRVREIANGVFDYHGIRFDSTLVSRETIASLERNGVTLTVDVIDTSVATPRTVEALSIEAERSSISSAIGFEEMNVIRGNLGWSSPGLRIVRGGGTLEDISKNQRSLVYRWTGSVAPYPDTVVVEASLQRGAGGKDIARCSFAVSGIEPYLRQSPPAQLYAGEDLQLDIGIAGLEQDELYSWSLYEAVGQDDLLLKSEGRGSRVQYRIPNSYAGKQLVVEARYRGRPYTFISSQTYAAGRSRFVLPVLNPPTQIQLNFPKKAPVTGNFSFSASRYIDPRFRGEQPIDRLADVRVDIYDEENNLIRTDVSMIRKGEFTFVIQDKNEIRASGERVIVHVYAEDASAQAILELYR
ncbi:hypothetical protein KQI65_12825 [bacterium]|nr:hypothetical protein [bacterium]